MKFAVVIGVGRDADSFAQATKTQGLLLEHLGDKLASIRLAVPRLLGLACRGALAERPDVLAVVGGPRTARAAGQIAHQQGIPILFLPGLRSPAWAKRLWGPLSLDDMIQAMAREDIRATRIGVGLAGEEMFFGEAHCGLFPQLAQVRHALKEMEAFTEGWNIFRRAMSLTRLLARAGVEIQRPQCARMEASALTVTVQEADRILSRHLASPGLQAFSCALWRCRTPLAHLLAVLRAARGADWRHHAQADRFDSENLTVTLRKGRWLVLDGEPVQCAGPTVLRFMPNAVRVCTFRAEQPIANDNAKRKFARAIQRSSKGSRNNRDASHVFIPSSRRVRDRIQEVGQC